MKAFHDIAKPICVHDKDLQAPITAYDEELPSCNRKIPRCRDYLTYRLFANLKCEFAEVN